jgi:hypothetical protein
MMVCQVWWCTLEAILELSIAISSLKKKKLKFLQICSIPPPTPKFKKLSQMSSRISLRDIHIRNTMVELPKNKDKFILKGSK